MLVVVAAASLVISDELFDYREALYERVLHRHGLARRAGWSATGWSSHCAASCTARPARVLAPRRPRRLRRTGTADRRRSDATHGLPRA
ncbi:MAG: hypothetical protein IPK27_01570 [Rhodanobacteraceae bacterium]|nr:hypothetical protein [Rhodanobacteraceae bacterium]